MGQVYNRIYTPEIYEKVNPENKAICKDFLTECKSKKKSEGTIKQYANDLRILCCYVYLYVDNKSFLRLTKRNFRDFVIKCTDEYGMSSARINRLLSAIHMVLDFCADDDELYEDYEVNTSAKVKGLPKETVREVVFLTDDLILQLWDKLMAEERYKEATLLGLLYDSGCRRNEIEQVERASITQEGNATNTVVGKRKKTFKCLYFRLTKEAFAKYEDTRTDNSDKLFPPREGDSSYMQIYTMVVGWRKDLKELSGEDYDINVHTFRHCYIENMTSGTHYLCRELNLGSVPIEKVKVLAHHSDVSTTDSYRSNDEERDIEELLGITL